MDNIDTAQNVFYILMYGAAPIIVGIVFLIVFMTKRGRAFKFLSSKEGLKIVDFVTSHNGISEKEYNDFFHNEKLSFKKIIEYLMKDETIKNEFVFDKSIRTLKRKNYYTSAFSFETSKTAIEFIDKQIESFQKNDQLKVLMKNFIRKSEVSVFDLELSSICFDISPDAVTYLAHNNKSEYSTFLQNIYFDSKLHINSLGISRYEQMIKQNKAIEEIENLFMILIKQNVISIPDDFKKLSLVAFCFAFYKYYLNDYFDYGSLQKELQIDFEKDFSLAINKLEETFGEVVTQNIYTCYICQKDKKTILSCYEECNKKVNNELEKKRQKLIVDNLFNGTDEKRITIDDIDLMNGVDFEKTILNIFSKNGYKCEMTKTTDDKGIDIIATKGYERIGIQCKRYNSPVGNHAIMEVVGGSKYYKCTKLIVICNNYFTKSAKELAEANKVFLWDRDELSKRL